LFFGCGLKISGAKMAQKKKKSQPAQKKQTKTKMSTSQKIMAIIGVFIILAMLLPGLLTLFQ
jgi:hypothetical protein